MMWTSIMIAISVIVISVIATIAFRKRKKRTFSKEEDFTAAKHQFQKISSKGINFCNVCNQIIAGFWSTNAQECIKCGLMVHQICKLKRKSKCKKVTTEDTIHRHQWIEQVDNKDICYVCQIKCINFIGGNSQTCMWCRRTVHPSCFQRLTDIECDCGGLANLIIRPHQICYHHKQSTDIKFFQKAKSKYATAQPFPQQLKKKKVDSSEDTETDTEYMKQGEDSWSLRLDDHQRPVVVVINKKSGGQLGMEYLKELYKLLNPIQVIDLLDEGLDRLKIFRSVHNLQLIVGGGDGTVASVANYIKSGVIEEWKAKNPPVAVLPLGTGNDLGRCLGWGGGSEGADRVYDYLKLVSKHGQNILLDRWDLECDKVCLHNEKKFKMYNYFSIGLDAKTCLNFHRLREKHPSLFISRVGNKFIYSQIGAADMFSGKKIDLSTMCEIIVDGKVIVIPPNVQNIVFLNITSWAGGATDLWKADESHAFKKQSLMDSTIEIIGVTSVLHLGQVQTNLDKPLQIAQGSQITLNILDNNMSHAFQIDGEPFELKAPASFTISFNDKVNMMTHKQQKSLQWDAQILDVLNWANNNGHINENQKTLLLNKFLDKN